MEVDPYELLVRWYLRFNGYLGVENFVVHQTVEGGNVQVGEDDILAIRFPNSRENPGFVLETDTKSDTPGKAGGLMSGAASKAVALVVTLTQ
jgi:hypothetical protein